MSRALKSIAIWTILSHETPQSFFCVFLVQEAARPSEHLVTSKIKEHVPWKFSNFPGPVKPAPR